VPDKLQVRWRRDSAEYFRLNIGNHGDVAFGVRVPVPDQAAIGEARNANLASGPTDGAAGHLKSARRGGMPHQQIEDGFRILVDQPRPRRLLPPARQAGCTYVIDGEPARHIEDAFGIVQGELPISNGSCIPRNRYQSRYLINADVEANPAEMERQVATDQMSAALPACHRLPCCMADVSCSTALCSRGVGSSRP
jgi:hypothetical protein